MGVTEKLVQLEEALRAACEEEQKLQSDVEAKLTLVATIEQQVIEKKQALANLKAIPTLSQDEAEKLKEHERDVLELQLSLNPDNWMHTIWLGYCTCTWIVHVSKFLTHFI